HFAILGDLVLPLVRAGQTIRIDVLKADEDAANTGPGAFFDEVRQLVTKRVDLDDETGVELLDFAQPNHAIEDRFPIFVPSEVIVGDEEAAQPLRHVFADDALDVVRRSAARLASLHVDDRAEGTLERATASGVEAGHVARRARSTDGADERNWH